MKTVGLVRATFRGLVIITRRDVQKRENRGLTAQDGVAHHAGEIAETVPIEYAANCGQVVCVA